MKKLALLPILFILVSCNSFRTVYLGCGKELYVNPKNEKVIKVTNDVRIEFKKDGVYMYSPVELAKTAFFSTFDKEVFNPNDKLIPFSRVNNVTLRYKETIKGEYVYFAPYNDFVSRMYYEENLILLTIQYYQNNYDYLLGVNRIDVNKDEVKNYMNKLLQHLR